MLALIDEESRFPRATNDTLAHKLHTAHANSKIYQAPPDWGPRFQVSHYAGVVEYELSGFLEKNRDTLSPSFILLMKCTFMCALGSPVSLCWGRASMDHWPSVPAAAL